MPWLASQISLCSSLELSTICAYSVTLESERSRDRLSLKDCLPAGILELGGRQIEHILLTFISAGAVGNLIDRIQLGYVRDFIYFSIIDFPVFNVADIYVTVSTALLVILVLFYYREEDFNDFRLFHRK